MTQAQTKSRHTFYACLFMRAINKIRGWSSEFQDAFFRNKQIPRIANINIQIIPLDDSRWKKGVFEKAVLFAKKW